MKVENLKKAIGQKVFVVSVMHGKMKTSDYGKLEAVNEPNNIIIAKQPFGDAIIPLDNGNDKILKVYDKQGEVIYDAEARKK
jgi:hypothetical protein